jgi:predicted transglutaminase-like cysteine proteinase
VEIAMPYNGRACGTLKIEVWKVINRWPDELYAQGSFYVSSKEGETKSLSLTWIPDAATGSGGLFGVGELAGYRMRVLFNGEEIWVTSDSLPSSLYVGPSVCTPASNVTGPWLTYNEGCVSNTSVYGQRYITPQDSLVIKYAGRLPAQPTVDDLPELERIYEFVHDHWQYVRDSDQYGVEEYWAYPHEVLRQYERNKVMRGDCEDVGFLMASLYEASGVSPNNIRVVCGTFSNGGGHIYAEIAVMRDGVKYWIPLEPSAAEFLYYAYNQHTMERSIAWNDVYVWQGV